MMLSCTTIRGICMEDSGHKFLKVYQIPRNTEFGLSVSEVGDISEEEVTHKAKLADTEINTLAEPLDGYSNVYMMRSDAANKWVYLRSNNPYVDTLKSFGMMQTEKAKQCLANAYSDCTMWATPSPGFPSPGFIDTYHSEPRLTNHWLNRYFVGHGSNDCYQGTHNTRCVNVGNHLRRAQFTLWLHVAATTPCTTIQV